jgi:cobalt transporter subunit CbtA
MLFRRIILAALAVGLVAGLCLSAAQLAAVNPIIFAAESYEVDAGHDHGGHDHSGEAWAPADGAERTSYTLLSNSLAGVGFAALLLAAMALMQQQAVTQLSPVKGLLWGAAGFIAFFLAPAIGLPPEIPGIEAAPVEHRQLWWLLAAATVAAGLCVAFFAPLKVKALALPLWALPYCVPIPHHNGPAFAHPDPAAVAALTELHQQFIIASAMSNLLFWLVLGALAAWSIKAWVLNGLQQGVSHEAARA